MKSGVYLVCPNNRKPSTEEEPAKKRKGKAKAGRRQPESVACSFIEKIADAQPESVEAMRYQTKPEVLPVG